MFFFVQEKKGLAIVCGDVGTGKTMLLNCFLGKLPDSVQPIVIANPLIEYQELLVYIAHRLGISRKEETILCLADRVKEKLVAARNEGKSFVLIVDEAHLLSNANLEHIRLFSNFETPEDKLLQILLVGQYELSDRLRQPGLRQLHQRININRFLSPLSEAETWQYVEHRLQVAGSSFERCFEPGCKALIHKLTEGVPRRINHLCDTAMLICMGEGAEKVRAGDLKKAREALATDQIFRARYGPAESISIPGRKRTVRLLAAAGLSLLVLGVALGFSGFRGLINPGGQKVDVGAPGVVRSPAPPPVASPERPLPPAASPAPEAGPPPIKPEPPAAAPAAPAPQAVAPIGAGPQEKTALPPVPPAEVASKPSRPEASGLPEGKGAQPAPETKPTPPVTETKTEVTVAETKNIPPVIETKPATSAPEARPVPSPPSSAGLAAPAPPRVPDSPLKQMKVEENDTLNAIAARYFPKQLELGLVALILANPREINNEDQIFPGQKLYIPEIDPANRMIRIKGNFYVFFKAYTSGSDLQEAIAKLMRHDVRFTVLDTGSIKGRRLYRLIIGGYNTREGLRQAFLRVKEQKT